MRDDTQYLVDYLPQLESTFSYARLGLITGLLPQDQQKKFGEALIRIGNLLVEHAAQPIEETEYNTYKCDECDHPRCWVNTPFGMHQKHLERIVEIHNLQKLFNQGDGPEEAEPPVGSDPAE